MGSIEKLLRIIKYTLVAIGYIVSISIGSWLGYKLAISQMPPQGRESFFSMIAEIKHILSPVNIKEDQIEKIEVGMTKVQVLTILPQPKFINSGNEFYDEAWDYDYTFTVPVPYKNGSFLKTGHVRMDFKGDKVIAIRYAKF